ncbi:MAG: hypothetical protein Q7U80_01065 [Thiobacillus sp.]|nr:hypothetical protein [Gammaproteobacteria bacterium]MDO9006785.1 hypothetical protein [Thiobacillus sp.]MDP3126279.1 hypothetical protein [Thiobacillus sp.]
MNIARQEKEPRSTVDKISIGLALVGEDIQVATRAGGREIAQGRFPASPMGTAALLNYLADWPTPLRLAVAAAGAASVSLALTVGAPHEREVFLVSAHTHGAASDLARYAERAI